MKTKVFGLLVLALVICLAVPSSAIYVACYNGSSATIGVNWTFTGGAGTDALVTNVGTPSNALLDFTIPTGAAGPQGINGTPGYTPIFGVDYFDGAQGIQGINGTPGVQGEQGIPGPDNDAWYLWINGTRVMTGILQMGGYNISNVLDPVALQDAATKDYVDTLVAGSSNYNATYDAKPDSTFNSTYDLKPDSTYNSTYDAKPDSTFNSTYDAIVLPDTTQFPFLNGTRTITGIWNFGGYNISNLLDPVAPQDAATRQFVLDNAGSSYNATYDAKPDSTFNTTYDAKPDSTYNSTYDAKPSSTFNSTYDLKPDSTFNATYDAKPSIIYNSSYDTVSNVSTYVIGVNASMKDYVDAVVSGVTVPDQTQFLFLNGTRTMTGDLNLGSKQITSLITGLTGDTVTNKTYVDTRPVINSTYLTSTFNSTYDLKPDSTYNSTYDLKPSIVYNASYDTVSNVSTYVIAVNASMKDYVDSMPLVNSSYETVTNTSSYVIAVNTSMKNYVDNKPVINTSYDTVTNVSSYVISVNSSMKDYVDNKPVINGSYDTVANVSSYVIAVNASMKSYVDTTPFINSSYETVSNTSSYVIAVNTSMKSYVDTKPVINTSYDRVSNVSSYVIAVNASMKGYVDAKPVINISYDTVTNVSSYVIAVNTSMEDYVDAAISGVGAPDLTGLLFTNGTRAMTGNLSFDNQYFINKLVDPTDPQDGATKNYVDTRPVINSTYLISTFNSTYDAKPDSTFNSTYDSFSNYNASYITSTFNATYDAKPDSTFNSTYDAKTNFNASYVELSNTSYVLTNNGTYVLVNNGSYVQITNTSYVLTDGTRVMTGNLNLGSKQITALITGLTGDTAVNKTYVDAGLPYVTLGNTSYVQTNNGSYVQITNGSYVQITNGSYVMISNTSYFLVDGTRTMTGNVSMGSKYITGLLSGSSGGSVVNKTYVDTLPIYNGSYVTTSNGSYVQITNTSYVLTNNASYVLTNNASYVLTNNGTYVQITNTTYVRNPVFGYITLMAGSGMVTTTNPGTMNQWETTTNKNNFIYWNFTDGGTETVQWIVDFHADWNSSANVVFTPIWTAQSGSGTVHWDISGKLFANDDAIDTALAAIGDSTDTLITTGDLHVAPDTAGAAITSVSSGGNTAIIKVARSSADDTLSNTAALLGLRVKYSKVLA